MDTAHNSGTSGRAWAYGGLALGLVVSECANVAHSYVPPTGAAHGWQPAPGAVAGSLFWPLALFVAIEILARVEWPDGARWKALRLGGLVPVAAVAAFVSYRHMAGLLAHYGEDAWTAHLGPLAVDGLMVMATAALLATTGTRPARPRQEVAEEETASVEDVPTPARHTPPAVTAPDPAHPRLVAVPAPKRHTARTGTRAAKPQATVQAAREAADRLTAQKRAVGRRNLGEELRAAGFSCSNDRAVELLAALNTPTTQEA